MNFAEYRADGVLRDGTPVLIRAIRPEDKTALREGFEHLSERTIYHRFLGAKRDLTDAELRYFTELDFRDHIALVAELSGPEGPEPIAVGRAVRTLPRQPVPSPAPQAVPAPSARDTEAAVNHIRASGAAEVAFVVRDEYQGRGVGTLLLEHLARIARELGYGAFEAVVLPTNRQMLEVFANSGLAHTERVADGLVYVRMEL